MINKNPFSLDGQVSIVTGGAGHFGKEIVKSLFNAGSNVIIVGRTEEKIMKLTNEIDSSGKKILPIIADITNELDRQKIISEAKITYKKINIIVNNAYFGKGGSIEISTAEDFRSAYEVSVVSAFEMVRLSLDIIKETAKKENASIINISSMYGSISPDFKIYDSPASYNPIFYGSAKAAMQQMSRYLAASLGPDGIRVNSISPGPFPNQTAQEDRDFIQRLAMKTMLGRIGQPAELANAVLFLASSASSYITGSNLAIDGGWTAW